MLSRFSRCWRSAVRERLPSPSPASSQNGEGLYSVNEGPSADINNGGGAYLATNTYATGIGPVLESRGVMTQYPS